MPGCQRAVGKESFFSPAFGDGADPSEVKVDDPFVYVNKGTLTVRRYRPDYGLSISDPGRRIHVPYVAQLPDGILNSSYVWKSGHTTLTFELDWNGIGEMKVVDGYSGGWKDDTYGYSYGRFEGLSSRPGSVFSAFSAKGKFNGSVIDSKVTVSWRKPVVFTDIYDAFSVAIADVGDDFLLFKGLSGKFSYDASGDDEEGNGKAYMFLTALHATVGRSPASILLRKKVSWDVSRGSFQAGTPRCRWDIIPPACSTREPERSPRKLERRPWRPSLRRLPEMWKGIYMKRRTCCIICLCSTNRWE